MSARVRKLIGSFGIVLFLIAYVSLVVIVADHLPDHHLVRLAYFGLAGLAWGAPLIPLIAWMNRAP